MLRQQVTKAFPRRAAFCSLQADYEAYNQNVKTNTALKEAANLEVLKQRLSAQQKERIEMLAFAISQLDSIESTYMAVQMEQALASQKAISPLSLSMDYASLAPLAEDTFPEPNPTWFQQQDALNKLYPEGLTDFCRVFNNLGGTGGGAAPVAKKEEDKQEEKVEEEVKVKTNFDVELAAIDPANKIKVIKEVRTLCGLGLKEAKEMVEKLPSLLQKQAIKADAESMQETLAKLGCTVVLK